MAKNYGDTVWSLARPGLVIEDAKRLVQECKGLAFILRTGSNSESEVLQLSSYLQENLDVLSDLLNTIPADTGPNIQTAATKALDQPIDVDVFANDAMSEV